MRHLKSNMLNINSQIKLQKLAPQLLYGGYPPLAAWSPPLFPGRYFFALNLPYIKSIEKFADQSSSIFK